MAQATFSSGLGIAISQSGSSSYGPQVLGLCWMVWGSAAPLSLGTRNLPQRTRPLAVVCWAWMTPDVQEEPGCWLKKGESRGYFWKPEMGRHVGVGGAGHSGKKPELRQELSTWEAAQGWGGAREGPDSWEGARGTTMPLLPGTCPQDPLTFGPTP